MENLPDDSVGDLGRHVAQKFGQFRRERNDHFFALLPPPTTRSKMGQRIPLNVHA